MADPTPEELQQQIEELRSLITTQYEPPTGNEYSYPMVNQPMNDEMWQYVTLGIGSGVLDEGGRPYWLAGRNNADNTLRISVSTSTGTAQAIVRGFYHRMTADKTFTVPGVTSTTTYYFCLTYDPTASTTPGGPISLQMYSGTPPTSMGRSHVVLWKVTRRPNELLTDATVTRERPRVSPPIYVWEESQKPDPSQQLSGALCVVGETGGIYRVTSEDNEDLGDRAWWPLTNVSVRSDDSNHRYPGHGARFTSTRIGQLVVLEGRLERPDGRPYYGSSTDGYHVRTLPVNHRPPNERRFVTKGAGYSTDTMISVNISADGVVRVYPMSNTSWISVDGVSFTVGS